MPFLNHQIMILAVIFKENPQLGTEKRDMVSTGWQHLTAPLAAAGN